MSVLLRDRHVREAEQSLKRQREIASEPVRVTAGPGGDSSYRVPTIGLNSGHIPGTRPEFAFR